MKVTIEFDDGEKREYNTLAEIDNALYRGEFAVIEVKHPNFGEHCLVVCEKSRRLEDETTAGWIDPEKQSTLKESKS